MTCTADSSHLTHTVVTVSFCLKFTQIHIETSIGSILQALKVNVETKVRNIQQSTTRCPVVSRPRGDPPSADGPASSQAQHGRLRGAPRARLARSRRYHLIYVQHNTQTQLMQICVLSQGLHSDIIIQRRPSRPLRLPESSQAQRRPVWSGPVSRVLSRRDSGRHRNGLWPR